MTFSLEDITDCDVVRGSVIEKSDGRPSIEELNFDVSFT